MCLRHSQSLKTPSLFSSAPGVCVRVRDGPSCPCLGQAAAGGPSSLSTTTGRCSCGGAGRADRPSGTFLRLPGRAYGGTARRQTAQTQRVRAPPGTTESDGRTTSDPVRDVLPSFLVPASEQTGPAGEQPAEPVGGRSSADASGDAPQRGREEGPEVGGRCPCVGTRVRLGVQSLCAGLQGAGAAQGERWSVCRTDPLLCSTQILHHHCE